MFCHAGRRKCHDLSWSAAPPLPLLPIRIPHAVPPSRFVPLRSRRRAERGEHCIWRRSRRRAKRGEHCRWRRSRRRRLPCAAGPCFARIARARRRALAPARFARLIARTRAPPKSRAHVSLPFLEGLFAPARTGTESGSREAASFLLPYIGAAFRESIRIRKFFNKFEQTGLPARFHCRTGNPRGNGIFARLGLCIGGAGAPRRLDGT